METDLEAAYEAGRVWALAGGNACDISRAAILYADDRARVADDEHFMALRARFIRGGRGQPSLPHVLGLQARSMEKKILGWHFSGTKMRDGRALGAPGEVETFEGDVVPCKSGLHASEMIMDALKYAPGTLLRRVELWGDLQEHGGDKHVGRFRRILWEADMSHALRLFARMCALDVRHLWKEPMPDVVSRFLVTGDESIRSSASAAARDAASAAAWDSAWSSASAAARDAASAAATAAAGYAVWTAARDAAWAVARAAARASSSDAARGRQERRLIAYANAARCGLFVTANGM